jgi:lysine 2,3-aminomutase
LKKVVESQNWTSEFKVAFKSVNDLYQFLGEEFSPRLSLVEKTYPVFIPRKLAEKIKKLGPESALAKEFLPSETELDEELNSFGFEDPIGDKNFFKAPQLIHRYENRALFAPTTICPVHCRYCFRKNELNADEELFQNDFSATLDYLKSHPEISEIIFTGGDPLTLSNEKLEKILSSFSEIKSIRDIRFHTRYPVIMPERIDRGLIGVLSKFADIFRTLTIAVHANHIEEFDEEARLAIRKLADIKVQLLSQTVLLNGVNDSSQDLVTLFEEFINLKVRPYYLHHPDRVKGGMHFYLPLEKGRSLYGSLRDKLPGWAIPHYVIDIPGGHGKVPAFNPESTTFSGQLLGKNGSKIALQEPDLFV